MFQLRFFLLKIFLLLSVGVSVVSQASPADVLVQNDLVAVTRADFEADLAGIPGEHRDAFLTSKKRISQLLENLLVTKTFAARARANDLDKDPKVRDRMALAINNVLSKIHTAHDEAALEFPDFEPRARELYLVDKDEKYTQPAGVSVSHILLETKQRNDAEAIQFLQKLRQRALNGESFEDLAFEFSEDPSARGNRGNLGVIQRNRVAKPFAEAAFALKIPGEISDPVETRFGYHLIQLHKKSDAVEIPFEKVKTKIIDELKSEHISAFRQQQRSDILSDPGLKLNEGIIDSYLIKSDYDPEQKL